LGPSHPETLYIRDNLAAAYHNVGRTAEAIKLQEATLKLCEAKLGHDHPDTLASRSSLAEEYHDAGRVTEAIRLHEATLELSEAKLRHDHPDTLRTQANLGACYRDAGRPEEGARLMEDVLRRAKNEPTTAAKLAWVRPALAAAYEAAGQFDRAEPYRREVVDECRRKFGPEDPRTAAAMAVLSLDLLRQEKWKEAEAILRQCRAIREKSQPDAWTTFNTRSQLGGSLLGQGDYAEAEPLILTGYEGMKAREATIPAAGKPRLDEAAEQVVRMYEAWGKPEKAAAWRARLGLLPADVFARH
jgi:tetratricopeptide (TPR) repeat protein